MEIEKLIEEMQAVKTAHPTLEISDVLKIFEIQAMQKLASELRGLRFKR